MKRQTFKIININHNSLIGKLFLRESRVKAPMLIFLHGMLGTQKNEDIAIACAEAGWNVFILYFKGTSDSIDRYRVDLQYVEVIDTINFLIKNKYAHPNNIGILGYSLGSRAAIFATELWKQVRILILVSPISNFIESDMTYELANFYTPHLNTTARELISQWRTISKTKQPFEIIKELINNEIIIIHGEADQEVSPMNSNILHKNAINSKFYLINKAGHEFQGVRNELIKIVLSSLSDI